MVPLYKKERNARSPFTILEASTRGGLGKGNLGIVVGGPGVGKTACLVHVGLDDLLRDAKVLHIALGGIDVDEVVLSYDNLFSELADGTEHAERADAKLAMKQLRIIRTKREPTLHVERLDRLAQMLVTDLDFVPRAIVVDGYDWNQEPEHTTFVLHALRALAAQSDAEVWMSACITSEQARSNPTELMAPCSDYARLIDVALLLEPQNDHVSIRLLKDHADAPVGPDTKLALVPSSMRVKQPL